MKKLALSDEILLGIQQPGRYLGNETNIVMKDREHVDIRFAMCFPDVYEIGMAHLGMQILYDMFNKREDTWCERVFSPWTDLDAIMRREHIPLFALESQDPVRDFDFLGITIQFEMCYTNILQILDLSGMALHSSDREEDDPIVIGGGPCTYNPEPIADFFDLFYIGEGETGYDAVLDLYKEMRNSGATRREIVKELGKLPGIYAPAFYDVSYNGDGTIASFRPTEDDMPPVIHKEIVTDLDSAPYIEKPIVPFVRPAQDHVVLEVMRGCIRGCRFCQAGNIYRPLREKSLKTCEYYADRMLSSTGQDEINLSSLSSSDYSKLGELVTYLIDKYKDKGVNISLPSLRIDAFSLDVMSKIQDIRKSSLTFAAEAGSQRLRDVINKGITEDDILNGSAQAFEGGWNRVKLYFMLGLPTENDDDLRAIADLADKVANVYYEVVPKEKRSGRFTVLASSSFFVPKPFTPFQWVAMCTKDQFKERAWLVKDTFKTEPHHKNLKFTYPDAEVSLLEGFLARGDRRCAAVVEAAYKAGAMFDSWTDQFHREYWDEAFAVSGVDPSFYANRERGIDEILPWDFIDCGVNKAFLAREWETARSGKITPNCRQLCSACGARKYGGGVCFEAKDPFQ